MSKNQKKSKNTKASKPRNWLAVHAFQRSGSGKHKDKSKYTRKPKHRKVSYEAG